jgi:hypothetical protein
MLNWRRERGFLPYSSLKLPTQLERTKVTPRLPLYQATPHSSQAKIRFRQPGPNPVFYL